jgi:hypothetical protein
MEHVGKTAILVPKRVVRVMITRLQRVGLHFETIIIIIIIIIIITFTQCFYNYMPEANHIPALYDVAVTQLLRYMVHVTLFPTIHPLHCTSVLSAVCVQYQMWLFCLVMSCSPGMSLRYCLSDFEWVPVAPFSYWYQFIL